MKLYFSPAACSLSPRIALMEAGLPFEAQRVDLKAKTLAGGGDFLAINPKGSVPALQLDSGEVLTEGPAIVQYIADLKPESMLAPAAGSLARYRLQEWLNFITSELHKGFSPLFDDALDAAAKANFRDKLAKRFDYLSTQLSGRTWLTGEQFTVADGYLFTVLNWCQWVGLDLAKWPVLSAYQARVAARPKVHEALKAEGLAK
ncbi:MAG TPA: glutathione transferase GstA [Usitatibacteraceae bacterium]|nr:glutathione transferase GstA [Usitatibacteraceae bacterium]